jgi:GNAT superfamily N-acetyltransferase
MVIRLMVSADVAEIAALSGQLGYPMSAVALQKRYGMISQHGDNGIFVAERGGGLLGWVHVVGVHYLESPHSFAEIGGLVVDMEVRRQRIGQALMEQAEHWAREKGYREVRLRSGLQRTDAHQFYQAVGYTLVKTGHTFRKEI